MTAESTEIVATDNDADFCRGTLQDPYPLLHALRPVALNTPYHAPFYRTTRGLLRAIVPGQGAWHGHG